MEVGGCVKQTLADLDEETMRAAFAGKFRTTILHFYAQTSDHVKRLTSVKANGKFSAPDAAMDAPLARPEGLAVVVADLRVRAL